MHLFAGAGGGLLADLILGHTPVVAVEWDAYACRVLRERASDGWFPNLRVWEGDIRLFDPSEYAGQVDCIHAGFPCQDISVAGKQAGVGEETRSGLYREVIRIARVLRPRLLYMENVAAIVTNGLGTVLDDLAALGYDCEWLCLRASDCWANHHRDRWWLLANSNLQHGEWRSESQQPNGEIRKAWIESKRICDDVSESNSAQREGRRLSIRRKQEHTDACLSGWWEIESNVDRVANGVAFRSHRLKAIGNGQVPLQAALAWKLLGGE